MHVNGQDVKRAWRYSEGRQRMKIFIDIAEDDYRKVQDGRASVSLLRNVIKNGTVIKEEYDVSQLMYEIYMEGVNMSGEYQGCWVRFKDIEKIMDKYVKGRKG
jgi:hypothetical protein